MAASSRPPAPAGSVEIIGGTVTLGRLAAVQANTQGAGPGGDVIVRGGAVELFGQADLSSRADDGSSGNAGSVRIEGGSLVAREGATISSSTFGDGNAGTVELALTDILIADQAEVSSSTSRGGNAGNVRIDAARLTVTTGFISSRGEDGSTGNAGSIGITATDRLLVERFGIVSTGTTGLGNAGDIRIDAGDLVLRRGGFILSENRSTCFDECQSGRAGSVTVDARSIAISGQPPAVPGGPFITSGISVANFGNGAGGTLDVRADTLTLQDRGFLISATNGAGQGGNLSITAGEISLATNANINADTSFVCPVMACGEMGRGGSVTIDADRLTITGREDFTFISADTIGTAAAGNVVIRASDITLSGAGAAISSSTFFSSGDAGSVAITADSLLVEDGAFVETSTDFGSSGDAGSVFLDVGDLVVRRGRISSDTQSSGNAGEIEAQVGALLVDGGTINTASGSLDNRSAGAAGSIRIGGGSVTVRGGGTINSDTLTASNAGGVFLDVNALTVLDGTISSSTFGDGDGGDVDIRAARILIGDGGTIGSVSQGIGGGGNVTLTAGAIDMVGDSIITASSLLPCFDPCAQARPAGDVRIAADRLTLRGGQIASDTRGSADGGSIGINVGLLDLRDAFISAISNSLGRSGQIAITADRIVALDTEISTTTNGVGRGGALTIDARSISIEDTRIFAQTRSRDGAPGGDITIRADEFTLRREGEVNTTSFGTGDAGSILITGRAGRGSGGRLTIEAGGGIFALSNGDEDSGDGGSIAIDVADLLMIGGAITADALGQGGRAGNIDIVAQTVRLRPGRLADMDFGADITSSTRGAGPAGDISIRAGLVEIDLGQISSSTFGNGPGPAGRVTIDAGSLLLDNLSTISTSTQDCAECGPMQGDAGEILLRVTGDLTVRGRSQIASSSQSGTGNAGRIGIVAGRLLMDAGRVTTSTGADSSGAAGQIGIFADELLLTGASSVESNSENDRSAGDILIGAPRIALVGLGSRISSANLAEVPGNAGSVLIDGAQRLLLLGGAVIETNSLLGAAGDIVIRMPGDGLLILDSRGPLSLISTSSGPGTGGRIEIASPRAIISNGGGILALGQSGGANVQIRSTYFISSSDRENRVAVSGNILLDSLIYDVSSGTVNRDLSPLDASGVLRGQCAAQRASGEVSQLVVRPVGPYGAAPDQPEPAPEPCD
jgi:large exoprotein involved in heme utilization and adhesion